MNLLIPQLIAGNLLPGSAEGVSSLFGGQQGNGQGNTGQFGFLAAVSGITDAVQPGSNTTVPASGTALQNQPLSSQDFLEQLTLLTSLAEESSAGQHQALQSLLEQNPQIAGLADNIIQPHKGGNAEDARNALLTQLFEQKDRLGLTLPVQQATNAAFADLSLEQEIITPVNPQKGVVNPRAAVQALLNSQAALVEEGQTILPNTVKPTLQALAIQNDANPVLPSVTPVNIGQNVNIPAEPLVQAIIPVVQGQQTIVTDNNQQQSEQNPVAQGVLNQNVVNHSAQETATEQVIQQQVTSETPEVVEENKGAQVVSLLGNKLYKKAEDTLQAKPNQGNYSLYTGQNTNAAPANTPVVIPTHIHLEKVSTEQAGLHARTTATDAANIQQGNQPTTNSHPQHGVVHTLASASDTAADALSSEKNSLQTSVADQITVHVNRAVKDGAKQITIHLEPASLGKVDIKMDITHDGKTNISILVDKPETMELLQRDAKQLQSALNDAGVKSDSGSLNFSMRGDQQGKFNEQHGSNPYRQYSRLEQNDPLLSEVTTYIGSLQHTQGIDIRV